MKQQFIYLLVSIVFLHDIGSDDWSAGSLDTYSTVPSNSTRDADNKPGEQSTKIRRKPELSKALSPGVSKDKALSPDVAKEDDANSLRNPVEDFKKIAPKEETKKTKDKVLSPGVSSDKTLSLGVSMDKALSPGVSKDKALSPGVSKEDDANALRSSVEDKKIAPKEETKKKKRSSGIKKKPKNEENPENASDSEGEGTNKGLKKGKNKIKGKKKEKGVVKEGELTDSSGLDTSTDEDILDIIDARGRQSESSKEKRLGSALLGTLHDNIMANYQSVKPEDDLASKLRDAGDNLVVIDFYAKWCGPCKMISPKVERLAKEYPDVVFLKVDVDECEEVASEYEISSMPTFVFIKKSAVLSTFSGANFDKLKETLLQFK